MLKNNLKGQTKMITAKLPLSISITVLFINQIIMILEKEKLEKKIEIILKFINGKPLTGIRRRNILENLNDSSYLEPPEIKKNTYLNAILAMKKFLKVIATMKLTA